METPSILGTKLDISMFPYKAMFGIEFKKSSKLPN